MVDGVVMLLVGPDGHVWASVSDFDRSGYGGISLAQAQEIRARRALAYEYLQSVAHPHIADAVDGMGAERIVGEVCRKHGHKIVTKLIGHDDRKEPKP